VKPQLESQLDELYQLPLEEFTNARNALAKTLSGADKRRVASLVKPSLPMWVINQLLWNDAAAYNALIDASDKLRSAHRAALSGRNADTHKAEAVHRTTVEKAFAKAVSIGEKRAGRLTETVRDAIRRTLAALPGEEPAGRLTREPPAVGFTLLTGVKPRKIEEPKARSDAEERRQQKRTEKQQREAERKARKEEETARKEKEKRAREIQKAEQALREAERRLAQLKG
jgi:hypothetical protein